MGTRLCATVEKPVTRRDVDAFGILSFEKAGIIYFGVRNTLCASELLNKPNLW
jgi:hypothetical protein